MMHSDNVLCERDTYLRAAVALWSDLSELNRVDGWEYRMQLSVLSKRYVVPDRGSRRHAALWRGLRTAVYDPMSVRERELLLGFCEGHTACCWSTGDAKANPLQ